MVSAPQNSRRSQKIEDTVAALLRQPDVDAAARSVGISVATLMRWQKEPEFQKAPREARRAAFGQGIVSRLCGTLGANLGRGYGREGSGAWVQRNCRYHVVDERHASRPVDADCGS